MLFPCVVQYLTVDLSVTQLLNGVHCDFGPKFWHKTIVLYYIYITNHKYSNINKHNQQSYVPSCTSFDNLFTKKFLHLNVGLVYSTNIGKCN